ncbi:AAA family ATPase [Clostridium swellfunianum]|uniref:ATP-dependent DNA helicase n=1 Tax=Clostridium swellfunianum TaxID=1367462 RepID=UPI00202EB4C4|nr:AAA family ATPase [Clostridium swellfunianum]MCM0647355.1 AAA family ATPase [Clostridium swellfunianum]
MQDKYRLRHVSLRVPWHDGGWKGCVCENPKNNLACLRLKNILLSKDEVKEDEIKGRAFSELDENEIPPCLGERGSFMADFSLVKSKVHPYASMKKKTHEHFLPTEFEYPPYSAVGVPYRWMLKSNLGEFKSSYGLNLDEYWEPNLGFSTSWVQARENQKELLDTFFGHIKPQESICIFYAKEVPFVEDSRRVIIGVGRVLKVGECVEYKYTEDKDMKSVLWERNIEHSIRPDFKDGFLMPYDEVVKFAEKNINFPIKEMVAFAPDDKFDEYSYGTEHMSNDTVIESLLNCLKTLKTIEQHIEIDLSNQIKWIDKILEEIWRFRGAYPGLGSVLCALGIPLGNIVAKDIQDKINEDEDPWEYLNYVFNNPSKYLTGNIIKCIPKFLCEIWKTMPNNRKKYLKLLSRFEISSSEAAMLLDKTNRQKQGINCEDDDLIENPYRIFEVTREGEYPISIGTIDRGIFPFEAIANKFPLEEPSYLDSGLDKRRIRALIIEILERTADEGHTLLPVEQLRQRFERLSIRPECIIHEDILNSVESYFQDEIYIIPLKNGTKAYQLKRLYSMETFIRTVIEKRAKSVKYQLNFNWFRIMDKKFGKLEDFQRGYKRENEKLGREEKSKALDILSQNKISTLIGPAGTGKTSVIDVLLSVDEIKNEEVLLLAPTGKARVRIEEASKELNIKAYTIAQFLTKSKRFDWKTFRYKMLGKSDERSYGTVIVDEASMLTVDMVAALLECIKKAKRIIFVGDIRQLPPIGAGRPFVDIVEYLKTKDSLCGELTVLKRQEDNKDEERDDIALARWFSGQLLSPAEDEIFDLLESRKSTQYIDYVEFDGEEDFNDKLMKVLIEELKLQNEEDINGFNKSLGAVEVSGKTYFNLGSAEKIEEWQILSPVRNPAFGCNSINHWIHNTFRNSTLEYSKSNRRKIPKPIGNDEVVYGDKVINVMNHGRDCFPKDAGKGYLANGEIGIVVDGFKSKDFTNIEFSSQLGAKYGFSYRDFSDENDTNPIELAYSITVHKAQGSQFDTVILVIPKNCRILSRELIYTALTRQKKKIVLLCQENIHELKKYTLDNSSETAQRLTNLFVEPDPIYNEERHTFLDVNLVHRNSKGDLFRSKSEVIISERLIAHGISYSYEQPLKLNGSTKYPDFTFENDYGDKYYWEHCGLMNDENYKRRWNAKLGLYKRNGIKPINEGGNLIITYEFGSSGIDVQSIDNLIEKIV